METSAQWIWNKNRCSFCCRAKRFEWSVLWGLLYI